MNPFENAKKFFHDCESLRGWDVCKGSVAEDAPFYSQCEPLVDIKTLKDYVDWLADLGTVTTPGCRYDLHASAFDEANKCALFFATFRATHTGDGGPVEPTQKSTHTDYVYAIKMNDEGKVESMTKIWNASWALRELGWM
ncbi:MAG: hypothetical protein ACYTGQ_00415 [Planctomycetota bacterium]|jgi:hypothetical protein